MRCFVLGLLVAATTWAATTATQPVQPSAGSGDSVQGAPARDPHSYAHLNEVQVSHVSLDLTVDFEQKRLVGSAVLRLKRLDESARTLVLDTEDLTLSAVTLLPSGSPAVYRHAEVDPLLGRKLEIDFQANTEAVKIEYRTDPAAGALQWLEPAMTAGKKHPFLLSQSQSILARTWVPLQDTPRVRFTYDAVLRVPT
jgi:leukotriene-A4 hydrolase